MTETVSNGFTHTDFNTNTVGNTSFVVTYEEKECTVNVVVGDRIITGIALVNSTYEVWVNGVVDKSSIMVNVIYSYGANTSITLNDVDITLSAELSSGVVGSNNIIVTYKGQYQATLTFIVKELVVSSISYKSGLKDKYAYGEVINYNNVYITVNYTNGTSRDIALISNGGSYETLVDTSVSFKNQTKVITLIYQEKEATFDVTEVGSYIVDIEYYSGAPSFDLNETVPATVKFNIVYACTDFNETITYTYNGTNTLTIAQYFNTAAQGNGTISVSYNGFNKVLGYYVKITLDVFKAPTFYINYLTKSAGVQLYSLSYDSGNAVYTAVNHEDIDYASGVTYYAKTGTQYVQYNQESIFKTLNVTYEVGNVNGFIFEPQATYNYGANKVSNVLTTYQLLLADTDVTNIYMDTSATVNNMYKFNADAVGHTFRLVITPDTNAYDTSYVSSISITIKVVAGYNAYNIAGLTVMDDLNDSWNSFKATTVAEYNGYRPDGNNTLNYYTPSMINHYVILHNDIELDPDMFPNSFFWSSTDADYGSGKQLLIEQLGCTAEEANALNGTLKEWCATGNHWYKPGTDYGSAQQNGLFTTSCVSLNGNYGSITYKEETGSSRILRNVLDVNSNAEEDHWTSYSVFRLFQKGQTSVTASISNISAHGNSFRPSSGKLNYIGMNFVSCCIGECILDNVIASEFTNICSNDGYQNTNDCLNSHLIAQNCIFTDSYTSAINSYKGANFVYNSVLKRMGGPAFVLTDEVFTTGSWIESIQHASATIDDKTLIEAYTNGTEAFYVDNAGANQLVIIPKQLDAYYNGYGQSTVRYRKEANGTYVKDNTGNYVNMIAFMSGDAGGALTNYSADRNIYTYCKFTCVDADDHEVVLYSYDMRQISTSMGPVGLNFSTGANSIEKSQIGTNAANVQALSKGSSDSSCIVLNGTATNFLADDPTIAGQYNALVAGFQNVYQQYYDGAINNGMTVEQAEAYALAQATATLEGPTYLNGAHYHYLGVVVGIDSMN